MRGSKAVRQIAACWSELHSAFAVHRSSVLDPDRLFEDGMDDPLTASLDLLRRLPPQQVAQNLALLSETVLPDLADDLLSSVDQPLQVKVDSSSREYLVRCSLLSPPVCVAWSGAGRLARAERPMTGCPRWGGGGIEEQQRCALHREQTACNSRRY